MWGLSGSCIRSAVLRLCRMMASFRSECFRRFLSSHHQLFLSSPLRIPPRGLLTMCWGSSCRIRSCRWTIVAEIVCELLEVFTCSGGVGLEAFEATHKAKFVFEANSVKLRFWMQKQESVLQILKKCENWSHKEFEGKNLYCYESDHFVNDQCKTFIVN